MQTQISTCHVEEERKKERRKEGKKGKIMPVCRGSQGVMMEVLAAFNLLILVAGHDLTTFVKEVGVEGRRRRRKKREKV